NLYRLVSYPYDCITISHCYYVLFFTASAPTDIYTLSLHDALPICCSREKERRSPCSRAGWRPSNPSAPRSNPRVTRRSPWPGTSDRKSTRLNSSHQIISYAVFCLKKKKKNKPIIKQ